MKFNVYTDCGDFLGVWAKDASDAERKIWYYANGRAKNIIVKRA